MDTLIQTDLSHYWHPCSQMKDYEQFKPLVIRRAKGAYLELNNGRQIIDAISSWWCKPWGHQHPALKQALISQFERFEHVIGANTCQAPSALLSAELAQLCYPLNYTSFASDGSCAIEIALKMAIHAQILLGKKERNQFMALSQDYHGETCLALSVSDLGLYREPYQNLLSPCHFIEGIPYVNGIHDPLFEDCQTIWPTIEAQLLAKQEKLAAIIVEPIVQGAAGMKCYSADFLRRLCEFAKKHGIYFIVDEIMTGLGRTGKTFAYHYANITPDMICLGKNLTGGVLPLSACVCSQDLYNLFYNDYENGKNFLHSHTFSGNALACHVGLSSLQLFHEPEIQMQMQKNQSLLAKLAKEVAQSCSAVVNTRHIGMIAAFDLAQSKQSKHKRPMQKIFRRALELGAWLRPLGNTLYWLPPYICDTVTLEDLQTITTRVIQESGI